VPITMDVGRMFRDADFEIAPTGSHNRSRLHDPRWILSSGLLHPRGAGHRRRLAISAQMSCRCDRRCGHRVSDGALVGSICQIFDRR
jgi:hypothetical protein